MSQPYPQKAQEPRAAKKKNNRTYLEVPATDDHAAWNAIAETTAWEKYRDADLLSSYDTCAGLDPYTEDLIERGLNRRIRWHLAKHVANFLENEGRDARDAAANVIGAAIRMPQSGPGRSIRKGFVDFVQYRAKDEILKEMKHWRLRETLLSMPAPRRRASFEDTQNMLIDVTDVVTYVSAGDAAKHGVLIMHIKKHTYDEIHAIIAKKVSVRTIGSWVAQFRNEILARGLFWE